MSEINYKNLSEITVTTQAELDMIPDDFKGMIYIESNVCIVVRKKYYKNVVLRGNSRADLRGNSSAELWENSRADLHGNSSAVLRGNSSAELYGNSSAELYENSSAVLGGNSSAELHGNSSAVLRGNSSAELYGNSSAELYENSSAVLYENSSALASGNSQVLVRTKATIQISGNARIVYMPKNINEFMDFYGIKHTKTKAIFYKAVRKKDDGSLVSDYNNSFEYKVGKTKTEECDPNLEEDCSFGIHISHLDWALRFGSDWDNLAIIECETEISDIVMPENTDGKVRTSKIKVLREVPLEECGIYGKILAKKVKK